MRHSLVKVRLVFVPFLLTSFVIKVDNKQYAGISFLPYLRFAPISYRFQDVEKKYIFSLVHLNEFARLQRKDIVA